MRIHHYRAIILCVILAFIAIHFRTYLLRDINTFEPSELEKITNEKITFRLAEQLSGALEKQAPAMDKELRRKFAEERAQQIVSEKPIEYIKVLKSVQDNVTSSKYPKQSQQYLLEADPYYYYGLTDNIKNHGHIGEQFKNGKFYNPLRLHPQGVWSFVNFHPYCGYFLYRLMSMWNPDVSLMDAVGYLPLILVGLTVFVFFFLCRIQCLGLWASLLGTLTLTLAPIYIQRSSYGWYDTDPYNFLFPFLVIATFLSAVELKHAKALGVLGGILTGLYAMFWTGWIWLPALLMMFILVLSMASRLFKLSMVRPIMSYALFYVLSMVVTFLTLLSPAGFAQSVSDFAADLNQFSFQTADLWPNAFVTVGETRPINFIKLLYLTGNRITFAFVCFGGVISIGRFVIRKEFKKLSYLICWIIFGGVFLYLALRIERTALFFVIPLAVFVAYSAQTLMDFTDDLIRKYPEASPLRMIRTLSGTFLLFLLFPLQVITAHVIAMNERPIMNDAWNDALTYIRQNTEPDAVIYSWWPPGHFITGIAKRAVIADGASQHLPECYWVTRFFMSTDEAEAISILGMLSKSGNRAVDYLQKEGISLPESIRILNELFLLDADSRSAYVQKIISHDKSLDFMGFFRTDLSSLHAYVLLYNDLIEKTLALSFTAGWSFEMAGQEVRDEKAGEEFLASKFDKTQKMIQKSSGLLNYREASQLVEEKGNTLVFEDGLRFNKQNLSAEIILPAKGIAGVPVSLFYEEQGELKEITYSEKSVNISALVFLNDGKYFSVLADRQLIRSILFQLYYLRARTLSFFEWVHQSEDELTQTQTLTFKISR